MRRPAPIEKETQGTAKPSLASRCFRQARRPCRQYVDLPRRRRHLLPQSFFSVRHFPGVVNPGGPEPVKNCGGAERPFDGRKRNGAGHDGAKHAAPAAPDAGGGSRRAAGAVFKTAHRGNGRDCARHQPDARSSFRGHSIPLAERKEPRIRICTPEAGAIGTEALPVPRRRTRVLRDAFLRESRRFRQPARKPDRRADIGAGSGMRDPAREQTAGFPCAPLPHPAEQGAAAENGRGTERRKAVPSQGRRQEYKPRFLLAAFGAPSELEREKLPGRQHEGLGIAATGARITTASPRKRMGRNAKRSAPGRGPGKFPLPPGRKLAGSPALSIGG